MFRKIKGSTTCPLRSPSMRILPSPKERFPINISHNKTNKIKAVRCSLFAVISKRNTSKSCRLKKQGFSDTKSKGYQATQLRGTPENPSKSNLPVVHHQNQLRPQSLSWARTEWVPLAIGRRARIPHPKELPELSLRQGAIINVGHFHVRSRPFRGLCWLVRSATSKPVPQAAEELAQVLPYTHLEAKISRKQDSCRNQTWR